MAQTTSEYKVSSLIQTLTNSDRLDANIRVPEVEIKRLDRLENSVRFTDGSGYFGQMTVFHHLHCIVRGSPVSRRSQN